MADIYVSCDLGKQQDYSAISLIRPVLLDRELLPGITDPLYHARTLSHVYEVPALERINGVPYSEVLGMCKAYLNMPEVRYGPEGIEQETRFVLDATGVGDAVLEMAQDMELDPIPIVITGGAESRYSDGRYFVPRTEIIDYVIVAYQQHLIRVSDALPLLSTLDDELMQLRLKRNAKTANESYESYSSQAHDDLVMSLGMGLWCAMRDHRQELVYAETMKEQREYDPKEWVRV